MEHLFTTKIEGATYEVHFDHEQYVFSPEHGSKAFPSFSFVREHDEWHDREPVPHEIRKQALDALERYLLKQH